MKITVTLPFGVILVCVSVGILVGELVASVVGKYMTTHARPEEFEVNNS